MQPKRVYAHAVIDRRPTGPGCLRAGSYDDAIGVPATIHAEAGERLEPELIGRVQLRDMMTCQMGCTLSVCCQF